MIGEQTSTRQRDAAKCAGDALKTRAIKRVRETGTKAATKPTQPEQVAQAGPSDRHQRPIATLAQQGAGGDALHDSEMANGEAVEAAGYRLVSCKVPTDPSAMAAFMAEHGATIVSVGLAAEPCLELRQALRKHQGTSDDSLV